LKEENELDQWGRILVDPEDVFSFLYFGTNPSEITCEPTEEIEKYNSLCISWNKIDEVIYSPLENNIDQLKRIDRQNRVNDWNIPDEIANLNVREFLLSKCSTQEEIDRVNMEMKLFEERQLIPVLRLMIALIEHFRDKNIVWGVGRGSSCSSYCLYLIGVHKINSIKYDLDIKEFLR